MRIHALGGYKGAVETTGYSRSFLSALVNETYERNAQPETLDDLRKGLGMTKKEFFVGVGARSKKAS